MSKNTEQDIYIASCDRSGGIYHYKMSDGKLHLAEITPMDRPSYMVVEGRRMYIVLREPFENGESGVISYDLEDSGKLVNPSKIVSTQGIGACHILTDNGEVYCANYSSGSVIRMPEQLIQHTGQGVDPDRQEGPHAHFVGLTPDKCYVCAADLGLDTIFVYDRNMTLRSQVKVPEGQGVRHLVFSEDGKWLFAANELGSTVSAFSYREGILEPVDLCSTIPETFRGENTTAAIRMRSGEIYVSNRGHDSVARMVFKDGKLNLQDTYACGGKTPRDFNFAGDYLLSANQDSDTVTVLDCDNGFSIVGQIAVKTPLCVCCI